MDNLLEQVQRALAMEQNNTTAVNDLKGAVNSLRDVISELGANAAAQAEALRGIKEVFTREVTQLRDDHAELSKDTRRQDDMLAAKAEERLIALDSRVTTIENKVSRSSGYWDGSRYVIGVILVACGGIGGAILTFIFNHLRLVGG